MVLNVTFPVTGIYGGYNPKIPEQQFAVYKALDAALAATPREHDYRKGENYDVFAEALREHRERVEMVQAVRDVAYQIALAVSELGRKGVLGSGSDRSDVAMVEVVLALGRGLGLGVVAEGVETEAQAAFLAAHGCDEAQDYSYGPPAPASHMLAAAPGQARRFRADRTVQPHPVPAAQAPRRRAGEMSGS